MTGPTAEGLLALGREGLLLALWLAAPIAIAALAAAIVGGVIGWVTQVQDPAIGLVPRIAAGAAAIALTGPHAAHQLVVFGSKLFAAIATVGAGGG